MEKKDDFFYFHSLISLKTTQPYALCRLEEETSFNLLLLKGCQIVTLDIRRFWSIGNLHSQSFQLGFRLILEVSTIVLLKFLILIWHDNFILSMKFSKN